MIITTKLNFQALFAGSIPEIIGIFKSFPKYNGYYVSDQTRRQERELLRS